MAAQDLIAFDILAKRAIDPALDAVVAEIGDHPDYVVSVLPDSWSMRTSCSLTITDRRTGQVTETLIIESSSNDEVRVERSAAIIDNGTPHIINTFKWTDVTKEKIEAVARRFVDDFSRRVSPTSAAGL